MAARRIKGRLKSRMLPLMAVGAAFSFTIMMYNVPIPDGTTAHAVGGGLLAVILGPWAASVCITIALAIQALLFGDGGIWSFGANCFNMAVLLPFVAYGVYRLVAGGSAATSKRRWIGAALGGYVGLNVAALAAGVELGLQPLLFHSAAGVPLYSPYPLHLAVPAMAFAHLTVAGPLEGVVTALVVRYLQASSPELLAGAVAADQGSPSRLRRLWWGVAALVVLSPLGLLAKGTAWGEWRPEELGKALGFVPAGLQRLAESWPHALLPDYSLPTVAHGGWPAAVVYIVCAALGVGLLWGLTTLLGRWQAAERRTQSLSGRGGEG